MVQSGARLRLFCCWLVSQLFGVQVNLGLRPNPSLHPTFNSRLRRLLPAGELQR